MGLLETVAGPVVDKLGDTPTIAIIAGGFATFCVLAVLLNVLQQLLFKNPHEPPVVFHWIPFIGSTVIYGMEPYKFFDNCRAKVRAKHVSMPYPSANNLVVWRRIHFCASWSEDDSLSGNERQRLHPERKALRCQCRRNLWKVNYTRLRHRCSKHLHARAVT